MDLKFWRKSLRIKVVLLLIVIAIVPAVVIGYLAFQSGREALEDDIINHLTSVAVLKRQAVNKLLEELETDVVRIATSPYLIDNASNLLKRTEEQSDTTLWYVRSKAFLEAESMGEVDLFELFVMNLEGKVVVSTDSEQEAKYRSKNVYFMKGKEGAFVHNVYYSLTLGGPALTISAPIRDDSGELIGTLAGRADLQTLSETMEQYSGLGETGDTYLVNTYSFFVTEPRFGEGYALKKAVHTAGVKECLKGKSGVGLYRDYRDVPVVGCYTWIEERELALLTEMDQSEAFAPIYTLRFIIIIVVAAIAIASAVAGFFLASLITKPIRSLATTAYMVGRGDLTQRLKIASEDELGQLAGSFNKMTDDLAKTTTSIENLNKEITERKQMEEALRQSEARYRALFEQKLDGVVVIDETMKVLLANQAAVEMFGFDSVEELLEFNPLDLIPSEERERVLTIMAKDMFENDLRQVNEFRLIKKAGEEIWISAIGTPIEYQGKVAGLTSFRDITEHKQAEERIKHLNLTLSAIRNVNQLITREKDRDKLLKGICDNLIMTRGYNNAWIALLDESEKLVAYAEAGLSKGFVPMIERLKLGKLTTCGRQALEQSEVVVTRDPTSTCTDCPLLEKYVGQGALTIRLEHDEKVYGLLNACIATDFITDEEITLFKEVTRDVGSALHAIELEAERRQIEKKLAQEHRQLEAANRAKSEFLSSMSHELRTPLNAIIGFSELLLDGVPGEINDEQRECLSDIFGSGQHLLNLINDVLDLSKVEAGKIELKIESMNLTDVIDGILQTVKPMVDKNRHKIEVSVEEGLPQVRADKSRLRQIFLNLLSNAIKFTPRGGKLGIEAGSEGDWCQVSVVDSGIGIRKEDQEQMFEVFTQAETLPDGNREGTGLGLALTRHFVELMGGRIWVESEYGKGSKFTFTLPLVREGKPYLKKGEEEPLEVGKPFFKPEQKRILLKSRRK